MSELGILESVGALTTFDRVGAELGKCDMVSIVCGIIPEFEKISGIRPESWPPTARARIEAAAQEWINKHADRVVRLVSTGATRDACFMILHHACKPCGG